MSTSTESSTNGSPEGLAEELHKLEAEEEQLATRTSRLELSNPLALVLSMVALAFGLGALVVTLAHYDNMGSASNTSAAATSGGSNAAATGGMHMTGGTRASAGHMTNGMTMGANGPISFTPAQIQAASKGTVYVKLGEFWVMPTVSSVRAGKVTFIAQNVGMAVHELMIERAPIKLSGSGQPIEDAAQGMIDDMTTGHSGRMTLHLTPGNYVLFCNVPGHYASGQHINFTVTK